MGWRVAGEPGKNTVTMTPTVATDMTTGSRRISRLDGSDRRNSGGGATRMSAVAHAGPEFMLGDGMQRENPPQVACGQPNTGRSRTGYRSGDPRIKGENAYV
ncbi:Uncharacterised protein [Mycobacterium tuberculosis]|uniref:Uncharacterized protein n=1 Tax=Mycobacterium tuberculosis TaxID=1773 RepID=A0A655A8B1_MYCTX|nr:Hypothetical protein AFL40_3586 [Mycobacterium tuberculosis]BAQ07654.1 hypothetical protein KURONO_3877 [Mycobacterium tuberculosis str. Kurono]CFS32927.1 Uncharacterised protein [Mycobacterium tuberculosis]CFS60795.1 Uncharacterised protein [Mycobacterium tuberculosis]CKS06679.1 Uncharacterised protein [Mycobacterium tuberculosis]